MMKYGIIFLFFFLSMLCFGQSYDTISGDDGKPGGYQRTREIDDQGNIRKIWFTVWKEDGRIIKEFSEYDDRNTIVARVESTLESSGKLIKLQRFIGSSIDREELQFSTEGTLTKKNIFLHVAGTSVLYTKSLEGDWKYSVTLNNGSHDIKAVDASEYEHAENLFCKRLESDHADMNELNSDAGKFASGIVAEYAGSDIRNTTPFVVTSPWEVHWDAKGEFFSIYLYNEGGELINVLGNQMNPGEGYSYYAKPGKYYFSVNTLGNWKLKVTMSKQ